MGASDDEEHRARRGSRGFVPPLGLLAVAFVLPTVRSCVGPISPLSFGLMQPTAALRIWPVFLLAALAAVMLLRGTDRARAVLVVPVLTGLAGVWPMVGAACEAAEQPNSENLIAVAAGLFALPLSITAFKRALRAAGWRRCRHAMVSFTAAAWLTVPPQYVFGRLLEGKFEGLAYGAYLIALAMLWLSVAAAVSPRD